MLMIIYREEVRSSSKEQVGCKRPAGIPEGTPRRHVDDRSGIPGTAQGQSDAFASLSMEMAAFTQQWNSSVVMIELLVQPDS